ncbi:hypothetical protein AM500_21330 [Bacillus sp. FJAT-18017]|uniref:phage holin family protein n=1 Tax=Bacillus sp. FJAT-18017 TaxID=1705566 RepID=UPI0006AFDD6A|nr:phage holin family protein [Bacillus sp. FJAT-18017]ALC92052.1 hypothetical protein AM500_21330 [Bacillus sp. FJAT-18017]
MRNYYDAFDLSSLLTLKNMAAGTVAGFAGSVVGKLYGGELHIYFILALILAILFDWAGGITASKKDGSYASAYGLQGVLRTAVMLVLPAWGSMLDIIFHTPAPAFFYAFWGGILFHTLTSMTANFTRAGWDKWIPNWAIQWVASEIEAKIRRSEERSVMPAAEEQAATVEKGVDE